MGKYYCHKFSVHKSSLNSRLSTHLMICIMLLLLCKLKITKLDYFVFGGGVMALSAHLCRGVSQMSARACKGEGGVKIGQKNACVLNVWPQSGFAV